MPRYKLRTLLILLAIGPPLVAGVWREFERRREDAFWLDVVSKGQPHGRLIKRTSAPLVHDMDDS